MSGDFHDHFSTRAPLYARYRPTYPDQLFVYLAAQCTRTDVAWDCGTGNGQAAHGLARYYRRVVATDRSRHQLAEASTHERITYTLAAESSSGLAPASVNLVTAAQALHWFDIGAFYAEARRVLRPGGTIAVWCYGVPRINQVLDGLIDEFYRNRIGSYWPPERVHVDQGYRRLPFPFEESTAPPFTMTTRWTRDDFTGYVRSWSAVSRCINAEGRDPVPRLAAVLESDWPDGMPLEVTWPLSMRVGRV